MWQRLKTSKVNVISEFQIFGIVGYQISWSQQATNNIKIVQKLKFSKWKTSSRFFSETM